MQLFQELVNSFKPIIIFTLSFTLDFRVSFEYAFVSGGEEP